MEEFAVGKTGFTHCGIGNRKLPGEPGGQAGGGVIGGQHDIGEGNRFHWQDLIRWNFGGMDEPVFPWIITQPVPKVQAENVLGRVYGPAGCPAE